jgi:FkbM family methyltransferase
MNVAVRALKEATRPARHRIASLIGGGARSFSAFGEDLIVLAWLQQQGCSIPKVRYLDIGAAHPINLSNTYMLYSLGASGVLVEPDPRQIAALRAYRRRDTVINAGVAFDERRSARLTRLSSPVFNTYSEESAANVSLASERWMSDRQKIVDQIETPLLPINDVIEKNFDSAPDFLSIDTEGCDLGILSSLNFELYGPRVICIEAPSLAFFDLLGPHGYTMVCKTPDNAIFLRSNNS